jgi:hypothetical protein
LLSFKQPCILDGDDRLVGKCRYKVNLSFCEFLDLAACQDDDAHDGGMGQQGYAEHRSSKIGVRTYVRAFPYCKFWVSLQIKHVHDSFLDCNSTRDRCTVNPEAHLWQLSLELAVAPAIYSHNSVNLPVKLPDAGALGLAQSPRRLRDRVKDGLHLRRRPADHTEHVTGYGLIFERLCKFVRTFGKLARASLLGLEQPCVLDGD